MKTKLTLILLCASLVGCESKPDFYMNGKAYRVRSVCIDSYSMPQTTTTFINGMPTTSTVILEYCDKYRLDTIEIATPSLTPNSQ